MIANNIRLKNIGLEKTAKTTAYNAFYASKLQDYVEEGFLFQNIPKPKNHTCWPRSPIFSHSIKTVLCDFLLVLWCRVTYIILSKWNFYVSKSRKLTLNWDRSSSPAPPASSCSLVSALSRIASISISWGRTFRCWKFLVEAQRLTYFDNLQYENCCPIHPVS